MTLIQAADIQLSYPIPLPDPVAALLADRRSPGTRLAYRRDLCDFFASQDGEVPERETVKRFVEFLAPQLAARIHIYKAGLLGRGLSNATVDRWLASVGALLKVSYRLGLASTTVYDLVDSEKVRRYQDTRTGLG